jgi:hypothetical protein
LNEFFNSCKFFKVAALKNLRCNLSSEGYFKKLKKRFGF